MLQPMAPDARDGVLLVGYGTVSDLRDLPEYLTRLRGGRPPAGELVAELRRRYAAIGSSPLLRNTLLQAQALEQRLGVPVRVAMRLWHPTIAEVLSELADGSLDRLCVLPLAPFNVDTYVSAVSDAARQLGAHAPGLPQLVPVRSWSSHPGLSRAHADQIRAHAPALDDTTSILLTAHSLPLAMGAAVARYRERVEQCRAAVQADLGRPVELCFQSQGDSGGKWLGPDVRTAVEAARSRGPMHLVVAPLGFLAEHLETLYDLDIECAGWAREAGLEMTRVPALGTAAGLIDVLADVARHALDAERPPAAGRVAPASAEP
jgi:ferrochelatase